MRDLFQSLTLHVDSLTDEGLDALFDVRPDVEAVIFAHTPDGAATQFDVLDVVDVLVDPHGVAGTVAGLSRPELQVLMALTRTADEADESLGGGFGMEDLMRINAGDPRFGRVDLVRLMARFSAPLAVDPRAARAELCGSLPKADRGPAQEEFDQILDRLTTMCLVWPEPEDGRLRLHDLAPGFLPAPGPEWDVFEPVPPTLEARAVPVESVDAEAQSAAMAALEQTERLLRQIATEPVPLIKAGGVGAREVKRLARVCGLTEDVVRFWIHVADSAGLLAVRDGKLWATPRYDEWVRAEPGPRYAVVFTGWLDMPTSVLGSFPAFGRVGRVPAALSGDSFDQVGDNIRGQVLDLLTAGGPGAVPERASLARALVWGMPLIVSEEDCDCDDCRPVLVRPGDRYSGPDPDPAPAPDLAAAAVDSVLTEGTLIGAVALGAAAPGVRTLFADDADAGTSEASPEEAAARFTSALAVTLPEMTHRVRVQGDMTVIAAGLPSARLTTLFDAAADRESAGAATVWRITDASVRRWLDAGHSAEELLAGFAEVCDDELPQPLRYLIEDAARRHGLVDVIAARAVVVAADAALAAELAALPVLVPLGVRRIADTVLVLDAAPAEVAGTLRFAGYLPSAHNTDGSLLVTSVAAPRASAETVVRDPWA